jgi:hypothetical protein
MKRYVLLLAAAMAAAALLAAVARRPAPREVAVPAAPLPVATLRFSVVDGALAPGTGAVPKDHLVRLEVRCRGGRAATLALAGYEDRLPPHRLTPGETWRAEFTADRPGDDFAWLLDGRPAGRLRVTGSHLVDGHR